MRKTLTQWLVQFRAGDVKKCCNVWEHMYMYKLIGRPVATSRPPRRRRMLGYRCPTQQANQFQVVHWREVLATTLKDTKLIRGANFWHQGSRKDRGEELADGAGSHLMYGGRQGSCFVRVWEKRREWVEKDVCQKMCSWGEHRLALACAQECCWGWLTTTGAPHCAPDLLVHRQNPGERKKPACSFLVTPALLPIVRWIIFKDRSSHNLSLYPIPQKMYGSWYTILCYSVVKLDL